MREDDSTATTGSAVTQQITAVAQRLLDMATREPVLIRVLFVHAPAARPATI